MNEWDLYLWDGRTWGFLWLVLRSLGDHGKTVSWSVEKLDSTDATGINHWLLGEEVLLGNTDGNRKQVLLPALAS